MRSRQRQLSLDELVHAALIDYPRYVSRRSGWFISRSRPSMSCWPGAMAPAAAHAGAGPVPPLGTASAPLSRARIFPLLGQSDLSRGRAPALVQVRIDGPVLLLMGPIGLFFARFCRYLQGCGIPVTKVAFPLREFGFPSEVCVPYSTGMDSWRPFLRPAD